MKKLIFTWIVGFPAIALGMQDLKNMSREKLEEEFKRCQQTIAEQQKAIEGYKYGYNLIWNLNYGTPLQRAEAKAKIQTLQIVNYISHKR